MLFDQSAHCGGKEWKKEERGINLTAYVWQFTKPVIKGGNLNWCSKMGIKTDQYWLKYSLKIWENWAEIDHNGNTCSLKIETNLLNQFWNLRRSRPHLKITWLFQWQLGAPPAKKWWQQDEHQGERATFSAAVEENMKLDTVQFQPSVKQGCKLWTKPLGLRVSSWTDLEHVNGFRT